MAKSERSRFGFDGQLMFPMAEIVNLVEIIVPEAEAMVAKRRLFFEGNTRKAK